MAVDKAGERGTQVRKRIDCIELDEVMAPSSGAIVKERSR